MKQLVSYAMDAGVHRANVCQEIGEEVAAASGTQMNYCEPNYVPTLPIIEEQSSNLEHLAMDDDPMCGLLDNLSGDFSNFSWGSTNGNGVGGDEAIVTLVGNTQNAVADANHNGVGGDKDMAPSIKNTQNAVANANTGTRDHAALVRQMVGTVCLL